MRMRASPRHPLQKPLQKPLQSHNNDNHNGFRSLTS